LRVAPHCNGATAKGTWIEVGEYPLAGLRTCTNELPLTPTGGVSAERTHCIQIWIKTVESVKVVVVVDVATRVKVYNPLSAKFVLWIKICEVGVLFTKLEVLEVGSTKLINPGNVVATKVKS